MPQVVIVIDELADLMLVASKEVEESICREWRRWDALPVCTLLLQLFGVRQADITSTYEEANIRRASRLQSSAESRIILDQGGAEKSSRRHGRHAVFSPVGCGKPVRIQGAFVSDEEREDVIRFIKEGAGGTAQNNSEIEEFMNKAAEDKIPAATAESPPRMKKAVSAATTRCCRKAVEVVLETKSCSVSMLQRRVKLGYSRAARIVDQMEELGIVGNMRAQSPVRSSLTARAGTRFSAVSALRRTVISVLPRT